MTKKNGKNGFYHFMVSIVENARKRGETMTIPQAQGPAGERWKTMGPAEREPFHALAKGEAAGPPLPIPNGPAKEDRRQNNQREFITDSTDRQKSRLQVLQERKDLVDDMSRFWPPGNELVHKRFFIVDFEYFLKTQEGKYYPCEVSAALFSMREGIKRVFHSFIDHEAFPMGYTGAVRQRSEERHNIDPFDRFTTPEFEAVDEPDPDLYRKRYKNHTDIYSSLARFFKDDDPSTGRYAFSLGTSADHVDVIAACLDWLFQQARLDLGLQEGSSELPTPLPLSDLVKHFYGHAGLAKYSNNSLERMLNTTQWDYVPETLCFFHREKDVKYCTQGQLHKWCYAIFDGLQANGGIYRFQMTENHLPPVPEVTWAVKQPEPRRDPSVRANFLTNPVMDDFAGGAERFNNHTRDHRPEYVNSGIRDVIKSDNNNNSNNAEANEEARPSSDGLRRDEAQRSVPAGVASVDRAAPMPTLGRGRGTFGRSVGGFGGGFGGLSSEASGEGAWPQLRPKREHGRGRALARPADPRH